MGLDRFDWQQPNKPLTDTRFGFKCPEIPELEISE